MADCREKVLAEVESIERVLAELPDCELSARDSIASEKQLYSAGG